MAGWREELQEIIFEADTKAGKAFDVGLLIAIVASEAVRAHRSSPATCAGCGRAGHELDAAYCRFCGTRLG